MKRRLSVRDVMSRPVTVVRDTDEVGLAQVAMKLLECHHVPVVDVGGQVVGVLSLRDVPREGGAKPLCVSELMKPSPVAVRRSMRASHAVALLVEHDLDALPVVDRERRPVGIVTTTDILIVAERALDGRRAKRRARPPETRSVIPTTLGA